MTMASGLLSFWMVVGARCGRSGSVDTPTCPTSVGVGPFSTVKNRPSLIESEQLSLIQHIRVLKFLVGLGEIDDTFY